MTSLLPLLLLLLFVVLSLGEPFLGIPHRPPKREHEEMPSNEEPCHFPFRYQRKMHYSCIPVSFINPRHWCATTENYDRDQKWRYCRKDERLVGHCDPNPCQNGGICESRQIGFHCICRPGFHGRNCEKESCFGAQRHPHIDKKDTWLQYHQSTGLEECHCIGKNIACKPVHGRPCATNPCLNGGHCLQLKSSWVCGCPKGFSGPLCDIAAQMSLRPMLRRWWVYPKTDVHWNIFAKTVWSDCNWKRYFRMPRAVFKMIVDELRPHLSRRDTRLRKAVPVDKQIAMAIMYLAHSGSYATVATFFGVGKSTAYKAIIQVILCMEMVLLRRAVYLGDYRKVMSGFAALGFPQVVGAIDGCHIRIKAPAHEGAQYVNRKQHYSMILQATCDHNGRYTDLFCGHAGSNHDSFVLQESPIYHALKAGLYVPGCPTLTIAGKQVGPILLGDGGYPIKPYLLVPFQVGHTRREGVYNRRLSRARIVVERSFGRLKSRFRALQSGLDLSVENLPSAILTCGILHNIIESNGEVLKGKNNSPETYVIDPTTYLTDQVEKQQGEEIREAFVEYFDSLLPV